MNKDVERRLRDLSRSSVVGKDIFEALVEIERLRSIADSNATNGMATEQRIAALEQENRELREDNKVLRESIFQGQEYVRQIPLHTNSERVIHYVEMYEAWCEKALQKGQEE